MWREEGRAEGRIWLDEAVEQPSPIKVAWNIVRVLIATQRPRPGGWGTVDHTIFGPVLEALERGGLRAALPHERDLSDYIEKLATVDPDTLSPDEALAYWLNLYNAGAVQLAVRAFGSGKTSVLWVPGGFERPFVTVAGEALSLDAVEHAKIRRFGDPRIHGALICGSLSCPTLRRTPYTGPDLNDQLDDQLRTFLASGAAMPVAEDTVALSRVFLWFGADFVRPHRMPTLMPAGKGRILEAVRPWLPTDLANRSRVEFQEYDWGLACTVR